MSIGKACLTSALREDYRWIVAFKDDPQYVCSTRKAAKDLGVETDYANVAFACNLDLMQVDCGVTNIHEHHDIVIAAWLRPVTVSNRQAKDGKDTDSDDGVEKETSTYRASRLGLQRQDSCGKRRRIE